MNGIAARSNRIEGDDWNNTVSAKSSIIVGFRFAIGAIAFQFRMQNAIKVNRNNLWACWSQFLDVPYCTQLQFSSTGCWSWLTLLSWELSLSSFGKGNVGVLKPEYAIFLFFRLHSRCKNYGDHEPPAHDPDPSPVKNWFIEAQPVEPAMKVANKSTMPRNLMVK